MKINGDMSMRRGDKYFFGAMFVYIIVGLYAMCSKTIAVELVQFVWILAMVAPLIIPSFGKLVGIRSLWGDGA